MNNKLETTPSLNDFVTDTGEPPVEGHDEWFRACVEQARDEAREQPERLIPFEDVRRRLAK